MRALTHGTPPSPLKRGRRNHRSTEADRSSIAGFTLIELIVSLTILAMLLALVPGTLRLGRRAWETPGQMDQGSDASAALAFVERQVKGAVPLFDRGTDGIPRIAFTGSAQSLSFVVPLSTGPYGGGLYRVEAGALGAPGPALRVSLYVAASASTRAAPLTEMRSLASKYNALEFRYFGTTAAGESGHWRDDWPSTSRLPDLVEIIAKPAAKSAKLEPAFRAELNLRPVQ